MAGSPRKLQLDGETFEIIADADFGEMPESEKEFIATSGAPIEKRTKMVDSVEGVKLKADADIRRRVDELIARKDYFSISYELADGKVRRGVGGISRENRQTAEDSMEITLHPVTKWEDF